MYRYLINNASFESQLEVVKKDAETGKIIPLSGFGFKIRDIETGKYITQHITYPEPMELDTFYTASTGRLMLPEPLKAGRYELVEVQSVPGYVLDGTPVSFTIDGSRQVVTVEKANIPQKGVILLEKTGEVFWSVEETAGVYQPVYREQSLAGAVFELIADEDIYTPDGTLRAAKDTVVDTLVTTGEGGKSKALYLGQYRLVEKQAPEGMVLESTPHMVKLEYAGQEAAVTETVIALTNQRQRVQIEMQKLLEQDERFQLFGDIRKVSFGLYAAKDLEASDGSVIPKDGLLEVVACKKTVRRHSKPTCRSALFISRRSPPTSITSSVIRHIPSSSPMPDRKPGWFIWGLMRASPLKTTSSVAAFWATRWTKMAKRRLAR